MSDQVPRNPAQVASISARVEYLAKSRCLTGDWTVLQVGKKLSGDRRQLVLLLLQPRVSSRTTLTILTFSLPEPLSSIHVIMNSNERWHRPDCTDPIIIVDNHKLPRCHICGASPSALIARLVAEAQVSRGAIHLPPETPLDKANFWWPPCVPWSNFSGTVGTSVGTSVGMSPPDEEEEVGKILLNDAASSSASYIYRSTLDSSRFRLMYITESEDVSGPIHIQLEDYDFDDHPEYETVSYTWGGENDDSTLCEPIFVGPFWDILLSTTNCSDLLQYLRPRKGCRVVWLDAVCIDQSSNAEKPTQISRMSDIYSACKQVVVYIGSDLIQRPSGKIFRPRVDFHQPRVHGKPSLMPAKNTSTIWLREQREHLVAVLAEKAGIDPEQLLKRRYLSRIWVVQELVFSSQAVFPLGDSDIFCNQDAAIIQLVLRSKGPNVTSSQSRKSITKLLESTSHCYSSDPRDRVFAVLNLFQPRNPSNKLNSDYSISWRDCWLGIGAYLLLIEGNLWLLAHAVGTNCPLQIPSWVPDIRDAGSWMEFQDLTEKYRQIAKDPNNAPPRGMRRTAIGTWASQFVMHTVHPFQRENEKWISSEWLEQESHRLVFPQYEDLLPWHPDLYSINSTNGALRLQALRVFNRPCQLKALTVTKDTEFITSLRIFGPSSSACFRILGWRGRGSLCLDKSYHVFIITAGSKYTITNNANIMLALATADSADSNSVVALNACWIVHDIRFSSMDDVIPKLDLDLTNVPWSNTLHSLHSFLEHLHPLDTQKLVPERTEPLLPTFLASIIFCIFSSDNTTCQDPFRFLRRLAEVNQKLEESSALEKPLDLIKALLAGAETICPDLDPAIYDDEFYLTFKNPSMLFKWETYRVVLKSRTIESMLQKTVTNFVEDALGQLASLEWEHFNPFVAQWREIKVNCTSDVPRHGYPFTIRISLFDVMDCLRSSAIYKVMRYAQVFSKNANEDLETLLSRSPKPEDRHVCLEGWGPALRRELGLIWRMEEITIL